MFLKETLNAWLTALKKEAELDNPDAMEILVWMYRNGHGIQRDPQLAKHYVEMQRNAEPFELSDDDDNSNPWMKPSIEV